MREQSKNADLTKYANIDSNKIESGKVETKITLKCRARRTNNKSFVSNSKLEEEIKFHFIYSKLEATEQNNGKKFFFQNVL